MNTNDLAFPMFVVMVIVAVSFVVIAIAMIYIAIIASRAVKSVNRLEQKAEPLMERLNVLSEQGKTIGEQFTAASGHISSATLYLSDSLAIIKDEVAELKELVSDTALEARDKVELVSRTIDRTQLQVTQTTDFIQDKIIEPAREVAAVMSGFRRGLEVLFAPAPRPINQTYGEDEMFIG